MIVHVLKRKRKRVLGLSCNRNLGIIFMASFKHTGYLTACEKEIKLCGIWGQIVTD